MNNIKSGNRCGKNYSEWIIVENVELTCKFPGEIRRGVCIARHTETNEYVTWEYDADRDDYCFSGHYFGSEIECWADYGQRIIDLVSYLEWKKG